MDTSAEAEGERLVGTASAARRDAGHVLPVRDLLRKPSADFKPP
ncbi:hypothetical protein ABZY09_38855 [Streptomyces sp. NPDC002928]